MLQKQNICIKFQAIKTLNIKTVTNNSSYLNLFTYSTEYKRMSEKILDELILIS